MISIASSLLPSGRLADVRREYTSSRPRRRKVHHAFDDGDGDVRHGSEPLALGQDFLREGEEARVLGHQEADRPHQVIGASFLRGGQVEVEPRVVPLDEDERRRRPRRAVARWGANLREVLERHRHDPAR